MFTESAEFYDAIYSFRDYEAQARKLTEWIEARSPEAKTILDVACGPHEHALHLVSRFELDGVDLNPVFLEKAKTKNPDGRYEVGDMRDFDLDQTYDVVTCLFSSIAYMQTNEELASAVACLKKHTKTGGLIILEPWITPDAVVADSVNMTTYEGEDLAICRMNRLNVEDRTAVLHFNYLIGRPSGVETFAEIHKTTLFTHEEMMAGFAASNLVPAYDPEGLMGRGLYIARVE